MNPKKRSRRIKIGVLAVVILMVCKGFVSCITNRTAEAVPLSAVVVQKPILRPVTEYVTQTGTMVAFNSVNLVARIKGYLDAIAFTDGTFVKKNKALFVIEPKPYLEQWKAAEASVTATKAAYAYDLSEYARQKVMYKQNATSLNNVEKWAAKSQESKAEIDKAVADAEIAAINYSYTHVLAPFDGRIGRHLVDVGNLVGNGEATSLAVIEQIDPIYVYFNLNELDFIKLRDAARAHGQPVKIDEIPVFVKMQNETQFGHEGKLNFVNTGLNASTGTMEFRALLPNPNDTLLPGLFVQVRVPISKPKPQLTVPDTAVQYDQIGAYVFLVDQAHLVRLQRVVIGALENGQRAILNGITPQSDVVIAGLQNAIPGTQVTLSPSGTAL